MAIYFKERIKGKIQEAKAKYESCPGGFHQCPSS